MRKKRKQKQKKIGGDGERAKVGEKKRTVKLEVFGQRRYILPNATIAGGLAWMFCLCGFLGTFK